MCGIYGMVSLDGSPLRHPQLARCMAKVLHHRGPDGAGMWASHNAIIGATRLRIVDRRTAGDQPFFGPGGTVLVCNGEIYNAGDIRRRYARYRFRSNTDVEPVVPLLESGGIKALTLLDGMFALAAWNPSTQTLRLLRDRAGEKPLFYSRLGNELWFASEIQALRVHPDFSSSLDPAAIGEFLAFGYVREPNTLHASVRKVPAGTVLEIGRVGWITHPLDGTTMERVPTPAGPNRLRTLIEVAVNKQLQADVPVGVFISGGLDSSIITALATRTHPGLQTFTARFDISSYDEGVFARRVAAHFRTKHHEVVAHERALAAALETAASSIAEPVPDPAILPTILLSRLARNHVGVALSGEGSDELFGGYPTYLGHRWAAAASRIPHRVRHALRSALAHGAASHDRVPLAHLFDRFIAHAPEETARRHANWFGTGWYDYLPPQLQHELIHEPPAAVDPVGWAMTTDFSGYLREMLLVKLDRASMLSSLETRAPFLDVNVVRYARTLDPSGIAVGFRQKTALAAAARGLVPGWVIRRRKRGLSVPIGRWINEELHGTVDRLLEPSRIANQSFMPDLPVSRLLSEHRRGAANHGRALWAMIVLQLWLEHWEGSRAA